MQQETAAKKPRIIFQVLTPDKNIFAMLNDNDLAEVGYFVAVPQPPVVTGVA